jgi:hypothetical protein
MAQYRATIWTKSSTGGVQKIEDTVEAVNATAAQELFMRRWKVSRNEVGPVSQIPSSSTTSSSSVRPGQEQVQGLITVVLCALLPTLLLAYRAILISESQGFHGAVSLTIGITIVCLIAFFLYLSLTVRALYIIGYALGIAYFLWTVVKDTGWSIFLCVPLTIIMSYLLYRFVVKHWTRVSYSSEIVSVLTLGIATGALIFLLGTSLFLVPASPRENPVTDGIQRYSYSNGDSYSGAVVNGKYQGLGVYKFANGDNYEGHFQDGKYNGSGIYTFKSGDKYEGFFQDYKLNGSVIVTYANGDRYTGQYVNDKRVGQGIYTWADRSIYRGNWVAGLPAGSGEFKDPNGNVETFRRYHSAAQYDQDGVMVSPDTLTYE